MIPVLLCITKYYSSTTLYCKELLQYYSVLQSATPVLLCATKYCFVLQSTTLLLCTEKYYSSTTPYYCTKYYSSTTSYHASTTVNLYYKLLPVPQSTILQYYSVTMRGATATGVTIQPHQIYRPCHAERLACFIVVTYETSFTMHTATDNFTKYCACHAERPACFIIVTYMKRHLQCAEQQVSPFNLTKCCACHEK